MLLAIGALNFRDPGFGCFASSRGVAMSERGFHLEVGSDALESVGEEMAVGQESALAGAGWRHVAVVLDAPARQVSVYLDGQPMGHPLQLAGAVDLLDCPVQHDSTFRLVLGRRCASGRESQSPSDYVCVFVDVFFVFYCMLSCNICMSFSSFQSNVL